MLDRPAPPIVRLLVAPVSVAVAVGARLLVEPLLDEGTPSPYLLLFIAVIISALLGGFWQGILATLLLALCATYLFQEPKYSLSIQGRSDALQLAIFIAEGVVMSVFGATVQRMIRERADLLAGEKQARAFADEGRKRYHDLMESLGVALYTTDATGHITYFNDAAVELWGRTPELGTDEWCGSWRLYHVDGTPMAHEDCPMAVTLKTGQPVRGVEAIAEKPDGTRVNFVPYPSPLHSASGELIGAVNVLIDITERRRAEDATRIAEERLRNLHDNAVFGIFQTDADGNLLSANDALAHIFGFADAEDLIAAGPAAGATGRVDPERRAEFARMLTEEGVATGFTAEAHRKDGSRISVTLSGRARRLDDGTVAGFEGIVEDITARVGAESRVAELLLAEQSARLEAETRQQQLAFLNAASGALAASLEHGLDLANIPGLAVPELADICEIQTFSPEGRLQDTVIACRDEEMEQLVWQLHDTFVIDESSEYPLYRHLQRQPHLLVNNIDEPILMLLAGTEEQREILRKLTLCSYLAVPLRARGNLIGVMVFASLDTQKCFGESELAIAQILARRVSVTMDNARLYKEAQEAQAELRAANEAKDEFLGVMAHELRTPITAIMGGARLLRSRNGTMDDATRKEVLTDIDTESDRMYRMVENLLTLGRLELGQEISKEPVLTQRVAEKMAASFMQRKPSRKIEVETEEDLEPALASQAYLELAIRNILSNADKYSPIDEPIEIRARRQGDQVEIAVLDRGPGISPDESGSIFDRYYRSSNTSTSTAGSGLGLTVCKRMMEAQSGTVWFRPREGGGSEIGVTLPVYQNGAT